MNQADEMLSDFARQHLTITHVGHDVDRARALREIRAGQRPDKFFDANSRLINSAEVLGTPADRPCPGCHRDSLRIIRWIHGVELGEKSGTARSVSEIRVVVDEFVSHPAGAEMSIHTVEVCPRCKWNYLLREDTLRV